MLNKPSLITLKLQTDEPALQSLPGNLESWGGVSTGSQYSSAVSYRAYHTSLSSVYYVLIT